MLARMQPAADVIGLDDRPALVAQARARAAEAGVAASFLEADPADLAAHVGARTPTKIVLTLTELRSAADRLSRLQAAREVIDPAGVLHVVDFGAQHGALMPRLSALLRGPGAADGGPAPLIRAAGFVAVEETATWRTPAGAVSLYRARAS
jgi:ubiquinone/menaquinone biosynthesis C-methylase UbiE